MTQDSETYLMTSLAVALRPHIIFRLQSVGASGVSSEVKLMVDGQPYLSAATAQLLLDKLRCTHLAPLVSHL